MLRNSNYFRVKFFINNLRVKLYPMKYLSNLYKHKYYLSWIKHSTKDQIVKDKDYIQIKNSSTNIAQAKKH